MRILLVDDEELILRSTKRLLTRVYGCEVITAATLSEAMKHLDVREVDIIITDRDLGPGASGEDFARNLRSWNSPVPIYLHSARPEGVDESLFTGIIPKGEIREYLKDVLGGG